MTLDASSEPGHHVRLPFLPSEMFVIQVNSPKPGPFPKINAFSNKRDVEVKTLQTLSQEQETHSDTGHCDGHLKGVPVEALTGWS